jgi:hypothetical protein
MSSKRIFRLAFPTSKSSDLRFRIHQLRDGDAFVQLSAVLYSRGYEFGELLLNLTSEDDKTPPVDLSFLTSSDLLVISTRPPLDDKKEEDKKFVPSSESSLEKKVFRALEAYFDKCARSRVKLAQPIARQLPVPFRERADITFREYGDGSYMKYRSHNARFWQKPAAPNSTVFYLVRIPAIEPGGPGLLTSFGMSGTETLIWNYLLRKRFPDWVFDYRFIMAEVELGRIPQQPDDLSFADTWELTPILKVPFHKPQ